MSKTPFRIAIRSEGAVINAYVAAEGTMDGAVLIGHISRKVCEDYPAAYQAFAQAMASAGSLVIQGLTGGRVVDIRMRTPPKSERAGHA